MRRLQPRRLALGAATVALTAVVAGCSAAGAGDEAGVGSGAAHGAASSTALPAFTSTTTEGATFDSAELDGTAAVLWFWAPWCSICRAEGGQLDAAHEKYGDDVAFLGVGGQSDSPDAMRDFISDTGTGSFTHLSDVSGTVWRQFGVFTQPAYSFVTAQGEVTTVVGSLSEGDLASQIESLI